MLHGHTGSVRGVSFAPTSALLASCGMGCNTLRVWNLDTVDNPPDFLPYAAPNEPGTNAGSDRVSGQKNMDRLHQRHASTHDLHETTDVRNMNPSFATPVAWELQAIGIGHGHTTQVRSCEWSSCGRYVLTACLDRTLRVWATATLLEGPPSLSGTDISTNHPTAECVPTSIIAPHVHRDSTACTYARTESPQAVELVSTKCLINHQHIVWQCALSPCGSLAASVSEDAHCVIYNVRTWQEVACFAPGVGMRSVVFENSDTLWAGASDGRLFRIKLENSGNVLHAAQTFSDAIPDVK